MGSLLSVIADMLTVSAAGDTVTVPIIDPPPPTGETLWGMNFEPTAVDGYNTPYEPRAELGRIYIDGGRTSIWGEGEFERAYDEYGIRDYVFSSKDNGTSAQAACMDTIPDDVIWRWINHHEPENDGIPATTWKGWQGAVLPIVADKGGIPSVCFMSYTVNPTSGRHIVDWKLPAGLAAEVWWDYYPNKEPNRTQAFMVNAMRAGAVTLGIDALGIGEYGIQQGSIYNAATVNEFQALTPDFVGECYWSNDHGQNQKFTPTIADAWFPA